nr:hypothetical protein [Tanacetum cinerariifolium]
MGDDDWIEVRRKNRGLVFNRLSHTIKSSADDLAKVSTSVYISNFPSHLTLRELWNICGKKGMLADVFIANHKNKMGPMFGFCRFIKVNCSNTLISSLNNIRIGKMRLQANKARFGRKSVGKHSHVTPKPTGKKGPTTWHDPPSNAASYANVTISAPNHGGNNAKPNETRIHGISISRDVLFDFPLDLLGCYNDFRSIANTRSMCCVEGFFDVDFKYLGGMWVLFDFKSEDVRDKFLSNKSIHSWFSSLKPWHDDFIGKDRL